MKKFFRLLSTPTARSSAFYYFGNFTIGVGRYFFHLLLLRLLLPSEYGEFLAYLSLLYILGIPNTAVSNLVVKFVAEFKGRRDHHSINQLFYYLVRKLTPISLSIGALMIFFANSLSSVFKAHSTAFVILGLSLFIGLLSTIIRSYLLAFQRFVAQIIIGFSEICVTLILAYIFIKIGLSATGAVLAQILSGIISLTICLYLIRKEIFPISTKTNREFNLGSFTGYSLIFAIGSLSLISSDVLLVRYYFSEHLSGIYSSLSVIGRIVYFGLGPLIGLVLPIASHRHAATGSSKGVFLKLGSVILVFGLLATLIFVIFPSLIMRTLSGVNYLEGASLLPIFAGSMLLFSFSMFILSYLMAIGKPKFNLFLLAATIAQPLIVFIFHQSLIQVVSSNLILEFVLFLSLFWVLFRELSRTL
ncbi:hypothetical protein HYU91_01925 [Candidatus Collierbacteria bacterium]|nr:hypothetical protein [Candidatus Collierbacteria bacterium]